MTAPRSNAAIDQNHKPTLIGVSTVDGKTPVAVEVNPLTGGILTDASSGVIPGDWNYLSYTSGSTTDTYVYKSGGSGGTTVATVTIAYTDSTKTVLSSVAWS